MMCWWWEALSESLPADMFQRLAEAAVTIVAVLFADMLDLKEVDIYTDVDGVYDKDPKLNEYAIKYDKLTYDEMLNMKSRVLHDRCVNYAKDHHIRIYLKGTFSTSQGTIVED